MPTLSTLALMRPSALAARTEAASSEESAVPEDISGTVPESVQEGAEGTVEAIGAFWGIGLTVAIAAAAAFALVVATTLLLNVVLRGRPELRRQVGRCRVPVWVALTLVAVRIALGLTAAEYAWFDGVNFLLLAGIVAAFAWLALRIVRLVEQNTLAKYQSASLDDRRDRKIQTQTVLIRRVLHVLIVVVAVAVILLAIPAVRAVGAGLLASAGLLSVIAGLAVQSTLTNVFAGIQLAFTDAIRVGDVVDVEGTFGNIEDITLSSVVVKIWDGRRMIYPSSHFTTTPFENWTRIGAEIIGTVEMELDWRVPLDALRERLKDLLASTQLWDGRESSIQVTDALGGIVKIRAVVSARNSGELWDLRCLVREDFVNYLRAEHPEALPTQRMAEGVPVAQPDDAAGDAVSESAGTSSEVARSRDGAEGRPTYPVKPAERPSPAPWSGNGREPAPRTWLPVIDEPRPEAAVGRQPGSDSSTGQTPLARAGEDSSMFTGSLTAVERNREFAGPGEAAYLERKDKVTQSTGPVEAVEEERHRGRQMDSD